MVCYKNVRGNNFVHSTFQTKSLKNLITDHLYIQLGYETQFSNTIAFNLLNVEDLNCLEIRSVYRIKSSW